MAWGKVPQQLRPTLKGLTAGGRPGTAEPTAGDCEVFLEGTSGGHVSLCLPHPLPSLRV